MIQIGKIRRGSGFTFVPTIAFVDIEDMLENCNDELRRVLKEEELYNIYFTVAHHEKGIRKEDSFIKQDVVAFDIDGIELDKIDNYPPIIAQALGVELSKCALVYSGNGIHIYIKLKESITDRGYFERAKDGYLSYVTKINNAIKQAGLTGSSDTTAWDSSRVLRVPFTKNIKVKASETVTKEVTLVQSKMEAQDFELPIIDKTTAQKDSVNFLQGKSFPAPDIKTIISECEFMKWCTEKPAEIHEPDMYAYFSILGHSNEGRRYALEFAAKNFSSPSIDACDKEAKMHQAVTVTGPRTCAGIANLKGPNFCQNCKHYNKITSPIQIKAEDFIATSHLGFTLKGPRGSNIRQYNDLLLHYDREHEHKSVGAIKKVYTWTGTHYRLTNELEIKHYAHNKFIPLATSEEANEFCNLVKRSNYTDESFLEGEKGGVINLANGVLDVKTRELKPHDKYKNFLYCLPYSYNPQATAPKFEKFLDEITLGRQCLKNIILEYMGYFISGSPYIYQKALIMDGSGKNGKTTLLKVFKKLAGRENVANISIASLVGNVFASSGLHGKLVNISEEEPPKSFSEKNGVFKNLTGDGTVNAQYKYGDAFEFDNIAKLVITYNEMPYLADTSKGMLRRLLIVPFDYDLENQHKDKVNPHIDSDLASEIEGIFNLALEGYARLESQKGFTYSKYVEDKINAIHNFSDVVKAFIEEACEKSVNASLSADKLYLAFEKYHKDNSGDKILTKRSFIRRVESLGVPSSYKSTRSGEKVKKSKFFTGLALLDDSAAKF